MLKERRRAHGALKVWGMMRGGRISMKRQGFPGGEPATAFVLGAIVLGATAFGVLVLQAGAVQAETVKNPIAIFAALDKVTGRISHLEVPIDQTVEFGALKVTPRVCDPRQDLQRAEFDRLIDGHLQMRDAASRLVARGEYGNQ